MGTVGDDVGEVGERVVGLRDAAPGCMHIQIDHRATSHVVRV